MWESRIIDYIDGKGNDAERADVERQLSESEEAYKLYEQLREVMQAMDKAAVLEPSGKLKMEFEQALAKEIAAQSKPTRTIFFSPVI